MPVSMKRFKLMNGDANRSPFNFFAPTCEFVQFAAADFFRRVHRWYLIQFSAHRTNCSMNFSIRWRFRILGTRQWLTGLVSGVGAVTKSDRCFVFLLSAANKLGQSRSPADEHY